MSNCLILKIIVIIKKVNILKKRCMLVKTKEMQCFIRGKIDFDKKKSCLKNIKGARLPKFLKIKTK